MPCEELTRRYYAEVAKDNYRMELARNEPFAKALREYARKKGYLGQIKGYFMVDETGFTIELNPSQANDYTEYLDVTLDDDLHNMAHLHYPDYDPNRPTMADLQAQISPSARARRPADLLDKPIPEMRWRWKRIVSVDPTVPDRFEKEWVAVEAPPAEDPVARIKKRYVRIVEVEERMPDKPLQVEKVVSQEELPVEDR